MHRLLIWWERGLVAALCLSVALLGVGPLEFFSSGGGVSAWSVSRTTFFFWLLWKLLLVGHRGWAQIGRSQLKALVPLYAFFIAVTSSLLPDFHQAGDYRYFFFGCAHAVMLVDIFSFAHQKRWLPLMLGVLPIILVARGLAYHPLVLKFDLAHRFAYPSDHANTAGYLFAMSIPLSAAVAMARPGWLRGLSWLSCGNQVFALILTFSRGAWLGAAAALGYLTIALKLWTLVAALLLVASIAVTLPRVQRRVATMADPQSDVSIRERWLLLTSSLQLGIQHPILGVGYGRGRLKTSLRPYLQGTPLENVPIRHAHNVYAELFAETGTIGLLTFLWLLGQTLWRLSRRALASEGAERLMGWGLAASWVAAMVTGLGDIPFYHHGTRIFFFTLFALAHMYYTDIGDTAR